MKQLFVSACLLLLFRALCFGQGFSDGLSDSERALLQKQEVIVRYINAAEKTALRPGIAPQFDRIIGEMAEINANYLAEALWSVPVAGYEDLLEAVDALFRTMNTFKEITYYSDVFKKTSPLFTLADLLATETDGETTKSQARFCMEPFSAYTAELSLEKTSDSILFMHKNSEALKVAGIRMVSPGEMRAGIAVVRSESQWLVYAAGGVRAPKPLLFKKSLEAAFNTRIRDFAVFYIKKVK